MEEIALAALAEASGKVVKWRRIQAALKLEIDKLYLNAVEENITHASIRLLNLVHIKTCIFYQPELLS